MDRKEFPKNIYQVWLQGCDDETIKKEKIYMKMSITGN